VADLQIQNLLSFKCLHTCKAVIPRAELGDVRSGGSATRQSNRVCRPQIECLPTRVWKDLVAPLFGTRCVSHARPVTYVVAVV
jgi:hypothetical protein